MLLRIFTEPQLGASYDTLLAVARTSEELGFDAFFRSDHYLTFMGDGQPGPTDAWLTLAAIGRETERIRLGTLMSPVTFRLPGPLAVAVAQADAMSGGRVELGLGAGWFEREHHAYGIPFGASFTERFEMLEEQLEIVTGLWSTPAGERYSFSGRHYALTDSPALPKPVQSPRPPILVGGSGPEKTPRLAARWADEFNMASPSLEAFVAQRDRVRTACEAIGRRPDDLRYSVFLTTAVGADEAEFRRRAEAIGQDPSTLRERGAAGTPGEVLERLSAFKAAGADRLYLQILDLADLDHLHLIAAEIGTAVE